MISDRELALVIQTFTEHIDKLKDDIKKKDDVIKDLRQEIHIIRLEYIQRTKAQLVRDFDGKITETKAYDVASNDENIRYAKIRGYLDEKLKEKTENEKNETED